MQQGRRPVPERGIIARGSMQKVTVTDIPSGNPNWNMAKSDALKAGAKPGSSYSSDAEVWLHPTRKDAERFEVRAKLAGAKVTLH